MTPADLCNAFCPATRTKVFFGGDIEGARAHDGTRYAALLNAFVYRDRLVGDCSCNGRPATGWPTSMWRATLTLRPGDIIATKDGLLTFRGTRSRRGGDTSQFHPDRPLAHGKPERRLGRVAAVGGE